MALRGSAWRIAPRRLARAALAAAIGLAGAGAVHAQSAVPDWNAVAAEEEVQIVVTQADGTPREVTVWLAVSEGQGYVRTGNTSWAPLVDAHPDVGFRVAGRDYALRARDVTDDAEHARVMQVFRDKYGFSDRMLSIFRGARPKIMRLEPRQ